MYQTISTFLYNQNLRVVSWCLPLYNILFSSYRSQKFANNVVFFTIICCWQAFLDSWKYFLRKRKYETLNVQRIKIWPEKICCRLPEIPTFYWKLIESKEVEEIKERDGLFKDRSSTKFIVHLKSAITRTSSNGK